MKRSGGIYSSSKNNLRKVKLATWEDPSASFHFGRDDISVGGTVQPHGLYLLRFHGDESSPLHWVYRVLGNTIHPHGLYSKRGGRQIAAPTSLLSLKLYFWIQMSKLDSGRICREMPGDSLLLGVPIS